MSPAGGALLDPQGFASQVRGGAWLVAVIEIGVIVLPLLLGPGSGTITAPWFDQDVVQ